MIENNRKEKEEEIRALKEVSEKRIEEMKKQYDALEKEAEARKELIDSYSSSATSYRSTIQDSISAQSAQAIELQSRMFISGGSTSVQSLQKQTAENTAAQKQIMEDMKRIEKETQEKIEAIKEAVEGFRFSIA